MKTKILIGRMRYNMKLLRGNDDLLKKILESMSTKNLAWTKLTIRFMSLIGITHTDLRNLTKNKELTKAWDMQFWEDEVNSKTSLSVYRERKIKKNKFMIISHHQQ